MLKWIAIIVLSILAAVSLVAQDKRMVITIDDLPNATISNNDSVILNLNIQLLEALYNWNAPAVGFVNEIKLMDAQGNISPIRFNVLERWLRAGMELGNHTYSHPDFNVTDPDTYFEDIVAGEKHIKPLMAKYSKTLRYFRHPYLHRGDTKEKVMALENYLKSKGYTEAPVTVDNADYIFARAYEITLRSGNKELAATIGNSYLSYMMEKVHYYERQSEQLVGRHMPQILLLHANLLNAAYLDKLLERINNDGYRFVFLEDALKDPAYQLEDKFVTRGGISWIHRWAISRGESGAFFKGEPVCPQYVQKIAGVYE